MRTAPPSPEVERLAIAARAWEPAGRSLLARLPDGAGARALDVGCGPLGWLRILADWVGRHGSVVGSEPDPAAREAATALIARERLGRVTLVDDTLLSSRLERSSFDLVHLRFQLGLLGHVEARIAACRRLLRPGGWLVLEDADTGSWHFNPPAPATERLISLAAEAIRAGGGDLDAGRSLPEILRGHRIVAAMDAHVLVLPTGDPYLRWPIQLASSLSARIGARVGAGELGLLRSAADAELADPTRWGTTVTLIQAWGRVPPQPSR